MLRNLGKQCQSLNSEKRILVHLTEFFKEPYDVCEFIIALLSLNVSREEIYQIIKQESLII